MPKKRYDFQKGSKAEQNVSRNRLQAQEKSASTKTHQRAVNERDRNFCITTYISVDMLEMFLRSQPWVSHWCYTTHDKDINEDGTPKEKHIHVLLYTYEAKTSSAVKKKFDSYSKEITKEGDTPQNTLVQICNDMTSQYRYQLHLDNPEKYQYLYDERKSDSIMWWNKLERTDGMTAPKNICLAVIQDILAGATSMELAERYGKDYVYHIPHYKMFIAQHNRETFLANANDTPISEYFSILLEGSLIPQERINAFFECLEYIKTECICSYDSKLSFYLEETKNK